MFVGLAAALGALAVLPGSGLAANAIEVGAGGTSIAVNGTTISTSSISLEELAELQGVPSSAVKLELEGAAVESPERAAVDALISGLAANTPLATALDGISSVSGGTLKPEVVLRRALGANGQPGAAGSNGSPGSNGAGSAGSPGANASTGVNGQRQSRFSMRVASRRLRGRPGSRVIVRFTVSSAASLTYSGRRLATGSRKVRAGSSVLAVRLPRKRGTYVLTLRAIGEGQISQTTVTLIDAATKSPSRRHH
ncbi:MAG TPA: collagen-like protein [Solirubrobacteraceae bacterium]|jgi:hypothetical protein